MMLVICSGTVAARARGSLSLYLQGRRCTAKPATSRRMGLEEREGKERLGGSTDSTPLEYHENSGVAKRDDALIFYVSRGAPQCIIMLIEGLPSCRMQIWKELTHVWVVASSVRYRA